MLEMAAAESVSKRMKVSFQPVVATPGQCCIVLLRDPPPRTPVSRGGIKWKKMDGFLCDGC